MSEDAETNPADTGAGVEADTVEDLRDVHPDNRPTEPEADSEDDDAAGDGQAGVVDADAEEEEEVEHKGKKYKLPKSLAAERMMQADYTRKTTELAGQRTAFEAAQAASATEAEALREDYGKVHSLKGQMALFDKVDWQALNTSDPVEAQALWFQREQTKAALAEVEGGLQTKVQERLQGQQQAAAKAMQETGQTLARDIKGWSPALANDIASFGIKEFGITAVEIQNMADPRVWKVLHRAMVAESALKKQTAGDRQVKIQATTPAPVVTARSAPAPTGLDDRQSSSAWLKTRNEQIARRNRR